MKEKTRISTLFLILLLIITSAHSIAYSQVTMKQDDRPNIVWIVAEDISPFLSAYGDSTIKTPNISRLADEGIRFTNAYSTSGVCAPSRAALITGMYPTSIGADNMRVTGDTDYLPSTIVPYSVVPPPEVKFYSELLRKSGYYTINNGKADYQIETPVTAWDQNYSHSGGLSFDTPLWRDRPEDQPFFAAINIFTTHESQIWVRADEPQLVNPEEVPIPPIFPDMPTVRRDIARNYSNIKVMDRQVGAILEQMEQDGLLENTIIFFYGDHGGPFPRYKRELYDTGLQVPLIIRFPDQRRAGTVNDELVSFVDFAPTLLSLAGIPIPSYIEGQAFLGDQKAPEREYIFGARDRMDAQYDMVRAVRDKRFKYIRNYQPQKPMMQDIAYRKNMPMMQELLSLHEQGRLNEVQELWFRETKPVEELYDTQNDPYETNNLANKPPYADKLQELRSALHAWERRTRDFGFTPEYQVLNQMWPNRRQPVTEAVQFSQNRKNGMVEIICPTEGASIAYQIASDSKQGPETVGNDINIWKVYKGPISVDSGENIRAVAIRYGYKQSEERSYTVQ